MNMKFKITILVFLVSLFMLQSIAFAGDFEVRPPTFIPKGKGKSKWYIEEIKKRTNYKGPDYFEELVLDAPLYYFSLGYNTEDKFFDRRINWNSLEAIAHIEYLYVGARLQTAFSSAGRDSFEFYDFRSSVYGFVPLEDNFARFGGGISYFNCDPYRGQKFFDDTKSALFINDEL